MNVSIRPVPAEKYLYTRFDGAFDFWESRDLSVQVLEACVDSGSTKVLFDLRAVRGSPALTERWNYAVFMADQCTRRLASGKLKSIRLVYIGNEPLIDSRKFGETVAANRGVDVKVTSDLDEALGWLGAETGTDPAVS